MATADDDGTVFGDRAQEGLDHLQAAAKEMIKAARALLDVAEGLVDDPATATTVVSALGSLAQAAVRQAGPLVGAPPEHADEADHVERITVT
jgi:hypothetical protein